jgi:hypothetical protein
LQKPNAIAGSVFMPSAVVVMFYALAFVAEYMEEQVRGWLLDLVSVSRAVILNVEPFAMKLTLPASKIKHRIDTREIPFGERYTVLVGQNSSGKAACLEAVNPNTFKPPHRPPQRAEYPALPNPASEIEYGIRLSGSELEHGLRSAGNQNHLTPTTSTSEWHIQRHLVERELPIA